MNDDEIVQRVEDKLAGTLFVVRSGKWVKDQKNRVGRVLKVLTSKSRRKYAHVEFSTMTRKGVLKKKTRAIWCDQLRST